MLESVLYKQRIHFTKMSANVSFKNMVVKCSSKVLRSFMVQWVLAYEFHVCWM